MKTKNFELDVLGTHKAFFLLDKLPKFAEDVTAQIMTPGGYQEVDFVDFFKMADGSIVAAWKHPMQKLGLQNLVAFSGDNQQVLNLYPVERVLGVLNKPLDSVNGVFYFSPSREVVGADWRCDRGVYGVRSFEDDFGTPVISDLSEIVVYESFLSVAGVGHIFYIEFTHEERVLSEKFNNLVVPAAGRTLQEILRLVWEWSALAGEPFNANDNAALIAANYLQSLVLSDTEKQHLASLPPMHIHRFLSGAEDARRRPSELRETDQASIDIVVDRMAASSLSFLVSRHPELWALDEVLVRENIELEEGMSRFRQYYDIPTHVGLEDEQSVQDYASILRPKEEAYIHNQLNNFRNKSHVLRAVAAGRSVWE